MIFPFPSAMSKEFGLYRKYSRLNHHKNSFVSLKFEKNPKACFKKKKIHSLLLLDLQRQDSYADIDTLINEIKKRSS